MMTLSKDEKPAAMSGERVNVGAVLRSPRSEEAIRKAAAGAGDVAFRITVSEDLDPAMLKTLQGEVILFDMDVHNSTEMRVLAEFVASRAPVPVVVTSAHLDVNSMRELMQIGVLDVIPQPLDRSDVAATLRQAAARRRPSAGPASRKRGSVISFIGSGGGVGTTSLAVHGACAIAGRKGADDLCLIDLDIQFGVAALLMDASSRGSILDLIRDPGRLDGALLRAAMVRAHDRFDVLGAPADIHPIDQIDAAAITATIATATTAFAHTILDVPPLWTQWTHAALQTSSAIVLVVHLTVPSLRQGRRQIDMLARGNLDDIPLVVVANRVGGGIFRKTGVSLANAAKALGRKVDHVIPNVPAMPAAADSGVPLSTVNGGRALEKRIGRMMAEIIKIAQPSKPRAHRIGE